MSSIPMRGLRVCEPCAHLARLTSAPELPGLIRRVEFYARIVQYGELAVGDTIATMDLGTRGWDSLGHPSL